MLFCSRHTGAMGKAPTSKKRPAGTGKADTQPRSLTVDGNRLSLLPDGPKRLDGVQFKFRGNKVKMRVPI